MKKIVLFLLILSLLLPNLIACGKEEEEKSEPVVLDSDSELVRTLVAYLEQYWFDYDLGERTFAQKIDDIKEGIQPLHVVFNPYSYYFVCGYYNSPSEHDDLFYSGCKEYTWVTYESATQVQEYYNDMKWAVVFQINRALTVSDISSSGSNTPNMEHFQMYKPTFKNGLNVAAPLIFNETFIYLNYPNCELNRYSEDTSTMYYCKSIYYHTMNTIPCVRLDDEYYIYFRLYTVDSEGERVDERYNSYDFGKYYDALMNLAQKDKYQITDKYNRTVYYGIVSFDDFVNEILR